MLQKLLEDRFRLKLHRDSREVPAYAVISAKGGSKLRPFREGSCVPLDLRILEQFPPPPFPELPSGQTYCGGIDAKDGTRWVATLTTRKGPDVIVEARAMSIDDFIKHALGPNLDRPAINRTDIIGRFDFHLEFAAEEYASHPGGDASAATSMPSVEEIGVPISTALEEQLGLKLEATKAPGDFLVIDHVQKPTAN